MKLTVPVQEAHEGPKKHEPLDPLGVTHWENGYESSHLMNPFGLFAQPLFRFNRR